jgi:hypothetical protein
MNAEAQALRLEDNAEARASDKLAVAISTSIPINRPSSSAKILHLTIMAFDIPRL